MNAQGVNALGSRIIGFISGRSGGQSKNRILGEVERLFQDHDNIVYSEEMILHTAQWRRNVDRTFELFGHLDVTLSYCLRDARKAVPSYYCESYSGLEESHRNDYQSFLGTEWSGIFDLASVSSQFDKSGFEKVNFFRFEDFVSGKLNLNQVLGAQFEDSVWLSPMEPPLANKKSVHGGDEKYGAGQRYTVLMDKYRSLPRGIRMPLDRLRSIGLGWLTTSIRQRMLERRELVVEPSPFLEELFRKNASFMRDR